MTGPSVADLPPRRIRTRLWAGREAFHTVDSIGTPFAGGGFDSTLHDLARIGQMMLDGGQVHGGQIVPEAAVDRIPHGGGPATVAKAGSDLPG